MVAGLFGVLDRTAQTAFFVNEHGGSSFLWENLFWFFGHPEVYIMALPGFGIVMEIMPVFTRKPLFAYKMAAAGMLGVALLSFFVWQHHLFQSGINPDMRPAVHAHHRAHLHPDRIHLLVDAGDAVEGEDPVRAADALLPGHAVQLPHRRRHRACSSPTYRSNVTVHGSFFVLAHFHYTIMGGLIFALFGGLYYWLPKMTGQDDEPQAEPVALLDDVHLLQLDVLPALPGGTARPAPAGLRVRP